MAAATPRRRLQRLARLASAVTLLGSALAPGFAGAQVPEIHETETIARCQRDLAAADAQARRRAVLVLGKYPAPEARRLVVAALRDAAAPVRLAALVALTENPLPPPDAADAILRCIADPDVHLRRLASSCLPRAMQVRQMASLGNPAARELPAELEGILRQATRDPDDTVRKNVAEYAAFLPGVFALDDLRPLLQDPSRDVRVLALGAVESLLPGDRFAEVLGGLGSDPDRGVRLSLARRSAGHPGAKTLELQRRLAADADLEVGTEALLAMFRQGRKEVLPELRRRLDAPGLPAPLAERIIVMFPILGAEAEAPLRELLGHARAEYRLQALRVLPAVRPGAPGPELCLALQADSAATVRQAAALLLQAGPALAADRFKPLMASKFADVRSLAVALTRSLPPAAAAPLLFDLLLDEDAAVRAQAVCEIGRRRLPDWLQTLTVALDDDSDEVAAQAADMLLQSNLPEATQVLTDYLNRTSRAARRQAIMEKLYLLRAPPRSAVPLAPPRRAAAPAPLLPAPAPSPGEVQP